jgi:DNA-binding XRE family transcriptional regulator
MHRRDTETTVCYGTRMQADALIGRPEEVLREPVAEPVLLRNEREIRRITREEMAAQIGVKPNYYRHIENGAMPSQEVKDAIRAVLAECPVHKAMGVKCSHKLPVPPDEELYEPPVNK